MIGDIKKRLRENPPTKKDLIKLSVFIVLYLLFLVWVRSAMGLLVIPFIVDLYTTKYINWTWWKKSENPLVRTIMSWVDAIVFALVAVYFVHLYAFQNFVIPSSSLEKSLLVGDYLLVSKMSYGPRKPITPLTMPLTQHTMPVLGCKSYIETPQWEYERIAGFGGIERNDIVVFNYPAGDIATTNPEVIDYYTLSYMIGEMVLGDKVNPASATPEERYNIYKKIYEAGDKYITSHPEVYGEKMWRPVDRRENYVKRCVGMPGDTLQIIDKKVYANGNLVQDAEGVQHNYLVTFKRMIPEATRRELGISFEDLSISSGEGRNTLVVPLTNAVRERLSKMTSYISSIVPCNADETDGIYPLNGSTGWTIDNYGPVWIPKRGESVKLTLDNLAVYERPIVAYEGNTLEVKDGDIYINGEKSDSYTFKMDYYWMMGDNRHKSADSRCWGFVPEDHIVGKPLFVWLSLDPDCNWFDGKVRWNRIFKGVDSCY